MYFTRTIILIVFFMLIIPLFGVLFDNEIYKAIYVVSTYAFGCFMVILFLFKEYHLPKNERIKNLKHRYKLAS